MSLSDLLAETTKRAIRMQMLHEEIVVRRLLEQWVSEMEPAVARDQRTGAIIGLTCAEYPIGTEDCVVVPA